MKKEYVIALGILLIILWVKLIKNPILNSETGEPTICTDPDFGDMLYSGSYCAGRQLDENKTLKHGDFGCEILLLQQRLNAMDINNILSPSGWFNCETQEKLIKLMGQPSLALNDFLADRQTGFEEEITRVYTDYNPLA